jgi:hypothetical protein
VGLLFKGRGANHTSEQASSTTLPNISTIHPETFKMHFTQVQLAALVAAFASAQTLNIPSRVGNIVSLPSPSVISGSVDLGNREFDRGQPCDSDADTGSDSAVFILNDGATLSNVIIGANALEGVHCKGSCTVRNVWFRDVCEDAVSALGTGNVLIQGGGAREAKDKVIQHNGRGTVTVSLAIVTTSKHLKLTPTHHRSRTTPSSTPASSTAPVATAPTTKPTPHARSPSRTSALSV